MTSRVSKNNYVLNGVPNIGKIEHNISMLTVLHLKTLDTFGNQHKHIMTNLWNWSSKLRDINRKKHPGHAKLCAFRFFISRPQILILRSRNQIRIKITSFSNMTLLQMEPFLTMFYTINNSPMLVITNNVRCLYIKVCCKLKNC